MTQNILCKKLQQVMMAKRLTDGLYLSFIYNKNPSARGVLTGLAACMLIHRVRCTYGWHRITMIQYCINSKMFIFYCQG